MAACSRAKVEIAMQRTRWLMDARGEKASPPSNTTRSTYAPCGQGSGECYGAGILFLYS